LHVTEDFAYAAGTVETSSASHVEVSCDFDRGLHLFDLRERLAAHAREGGLDVWFGRGGELHVAGLPGGRDVDGIAVERRLRLRVVEDEQFGTALIARHGTRWTAPLTNPNVVAAAVGERVYRRGIGEPRAVTVVRGLGNGRVVVAADGNEIEVAADDFTLAVNSAYIRRNHGSNTLQNVLVAAGSLTSSHQRNRYAVKDRFVAMGQSLSALGWKFDLGGGRAAEIEPTLAEIRIQEAS
jgi:hypothetical protein